MKGRGLPNSRLFSHPGGVTMNFMNRSDNTRPSFLLRLRDRADRLTWNEFDRKYGHMLYRYARSRGASHDDAEDVVQEVEMHLFQALDGFEYDAGKGRFRAYLRTAVVHALGRRASKQARQPQEIDPRTFDHTLNPEETPVDALWEREWELQGLRWAIQAIASEFDPPTLKAFELHVLAGYTVQETAEQLDASIWSVYRARKRVLQRLRQRLEEQPDREWE